MGNTNGGYWTPVPANSTVSDSKAGKPDGSGYTAQEMDKMGEPNVTPQLTRTGTPFDQYDGNPPLVLSPEFLPPLPTTDFDTYRLNDMVDMVEGSLPQQLEDVGDALWTAASELKKAGGELKKHIGDVEWGGMAASAFRDWGAELGSSTLHFGDYVATVGTQLKAAGVGLAMVKSSVTPLRYDGPGLTIQDIPSPARVKGNLGMKNLESKGLKEENAKAEANRKEAVIQMNKLSSYYTVSRDNMKIAEMPTFPPMPRVGVPRPEGSDLGGSPAQSDAADVPSGNTPADGARGTSDMPARRADDPVSGGVSAPVDSDPTRPHSQPGQGTPREVGAIPDAPVSTDINSTAPPVTPPNGGGPGTAPPPTTTQGPMGQPPTGGGPGMPPTTMMSPPGKIGGGPSFKPPTSPVQGGLGRPGPMSPGPTGRPGPMTPGQLSPGQTGPGGRTIGQPTGQSGMGRPGMMGPGMMGPSGGTAGGHGPSNGGARAARPGGIVGGTPSRAQPPSGKSSGIPRGTVVGGQNSSAGRPVGMGGVPGAMGPRGTGSASGQGVSGRRIASSPGGVVGTPRGGDSAQGKARREFTPGGSGLVREGSQGTGAPGSKGKSRSRERSREEQRGQDNPANAEEAGPTGQRGIVPPVVE